MKHRTAWQVEPCNTYLLHQLAVNDVCVTATEIKVRKFMRYAWRLFQFTWKNIQHKLQTLYSVLIKHHSMSTAAAAFQRSTRSSAESAAVQSLYGANQPDSRVSWPQTTPVHQRLTTISQCPGYWCQLPRCINDVAEWLCSNRLHLNPARTLAMWLGSKQQVDRVRAHNLPAVRMLQRAS